MRLHEMDSILQSKATEHLTRVVRSHAKPIAYDQKFPARSLDVTDQKTIF